MRAKNKKNPRICKSLSHFIKYVQHVESIMCFYLSDAFTQSKQRTRLQHQTESCSRRSKKRRCQWMRPTDSGCWSACSARWAGRCGPGRRSYIGESRGPSHRLWSPDGLIRNMEHIQTTGPQSVEQMGILSLTHLTYCFGHFLRPFYFIFLLLEVTGKYVLQYFCGSSNGKTLVRSCVTRKTIIAQIFFLFVKWNQLHWVVHL